MYLRHKEYGSRPRRYIGTAHAKSSIGAVHLGTGRRGLSIKLSGTEWEEWTWSADSLRFQGPWESWMETCRRHRRKQIMIRGLDPFAQKSQVTLPHSH